jgi:hypothetical protein
VSGCRALAAALALGLSAGPSAAAPKKGLERARELFQQNRWADTRAQLRSDWGALPPAEQSAASFLIGRSYVREAEFYRAVRRMGADVGLAYLSELSSAAVNRDVIWVRLFLGLQQLEAGKDSEAERSLMASVQAKALPAEWKELARLRAAVALHRLGRGTSSSFAGSSHEAHYWRHVIQRQPAPAELPAAASRRDKLLGACLFFRTGRHEQAEALLAGLNPDVPDVEDTRDPKKTLRFFDPLLLVALERIAWERALVFLRPLAQAGEGPENQLAAYYAGLSLFQLGSPNAIRFLSGLDAAVVGAPLQARARLLAEATAWESGRPAPAEVASLWEATQADPEALLLWKEVERPELASMEPFSSKLKARLRELPEASPVRPSGAVVGQWGLIELGAGSDPAEVLAVLSRFRNHSNKNRLEWNDPLLLIALSAANYRDNEYAQALETLFELSKAFPGLRALQWNLQGVYAARQQSAGDARISR